MKTEIAFVLALLLTGTSAAIAQSNPQFSKANQEYAGGDFNAAISHYEELVRSRQDTPNLFYNLGNAYFRKKDLGRAILNYERALALDPRHPEAQANLRIARDEARALELIPPKIERVLSFATLNQYSLTAAIAFWIFAFCVVALIFNRRRNRSATMLSILSLLVCERNHGDQSARGLDLCGAAE